MKINIRGCPSQNPVLPSTSASTSTRTVPHFSKTSKDHSSSRYSPRTSRISSESKSQHAAPRTFYLPFPIQRSVVIPSTPEEISKPEPGFTQYVSKETNIPNGDFHFQADRNQDRQSMCRFLSSDRLRYRRHLRRSLSQNPVLPSTSAKRPTSQMEIFTTKRTGIKTHSLSKTPHIMRTHIKDSRHFASQAGHSTSKPGDTKTPDKEHYSHALNRMSRASHKNHNRKIDISSEAQRSGSLNQECTKPLAPQTGEQPITKI